MSSGLEPNYCDEYATIRDTYSGRETSICGGDDRTQSSVYVSQKNGVEVRMRSRFNSIEGYHFLLSFEG